MNFVSYLKSKNIDEKTITQIDSLFSQKTLPKGTQLLNCDNQSCTFFFIEKGLARAYYIKNNKDITHQFFIENHIYLPIENVFFNKVSPYALELLEDSVIQTVDYFALESFIKTNHEFQYFVFQVTIGVINNLATKLYSLQFQTAEERYKIMLKIYPNIILRAPLGHIASYLGITQQTLSVVRAQKP